jgi:hypothetical protein
LAADDKFVSLDTAGKPFAVVADGASPEFMQPTPSCLVAAKAKQIF